jgi:hypothetical protein
MTVAAAGHRKASCPHAEAMPQDVPSHPQLDSSHTHQHCSCCCCCKRQGLFDVQRAWPAWAPPTKKHQYQRCVQCITAGIGGFRPC